MLHTIVLEMKDERSSQAPSLETLVKHWTCLLTPPVRSQLCGNILALK